MKLLEDNSDRTLLKNNSDQTLLEDISDRTLLEEDFQLMLLLLIVPINDAVVVVNSSD